MNQKNPMMKRLLKKKTKNMLTLMMRFLMMKLWKKRKNPNQKSLKMRLQKRVTNIQKKLNLLRM